LLAVFINPLAGKGRPIKIWERVRLLLDQDGIAYQAHHLDLPATLDGHSGILIIGGDGTINHVLNRYPDLRIPIGIIPAGSGNDLASSLFPGTDIVDQYRNAVHGTPRPTDAGICNGKIFLNGVGIGFDGEVALDIHKVKWLTGKMKYMSVVLRKIFTYKERRMRLEWEGKVMERDIFMVSVANGYRYGGGFKVAPLADWQDGLLDVVIIDKVSVLQRIRYLPVIERGMHLNLSFVKASLAKSIRISSSAVMHAHLDGELMSSDTFTISVLPAKFLFRYDKI
jgi:YegS/Rv2252/BmrU family lipid kinase